MLRCTPPVRLRRSRRPYSSSSGCTSANSNGRGRGQPDSAGERADRSTASRACRARNRSCHRRVDGRMHAAQVARGLCRLKTVLAPLDARRGWPTDGIARYIEKGRFA
jgi:hypothetical protein